MTQEEKLEEAKRLYETANADQRYVLESLFPELKESEDENIRKWLICGMNALKEQKNETFATIPIDDAIAWLEKQGEQKPADNFKPKFKVGEWVVNKLGNVWHIDSFDNKNYKVTDINGNRNCFPISIQDRIHLWTIQDAKAGDVLIDEDVNVIGIFEGIEGMCWHSKFYYSNTTKEFYGIEYGGSHQKEFAKPATKEQRNTLMKAMADAGWEFDFKNKELKKIDNEEVNGEDYGIDGLWHAQRILEKTLGSVDGYQSDDGILDHKAAITAVKKLYKQKPWSEEDEKMITAIRKLISDVEDDTGWNCVYSDDEEIYFSEINNWLKSLKPQNTWKPSDEQMESLFALLPTTCSSNPIFSLYEDLKKLKG